MNSLADIVVKATPEKRFLLVKRGLYYAPNSSGYTGFKERAGRYLESDASPQSGVTAIHEDEADEIAPNCFDDLAREYLSGKVSTLAALVLEARERLKATHAWINNDDADRFGPVETSAWNKLLDATEATLAKLEALKP